MTQCEIPFNYHSLPALSTNYANANVEIVPSGARDAKGRAKNHVKICAYILKNEKKTYICIYMYIMFYFVIISAYVCIYKKYSNNIRSLAKRNCREHTRFPFNVCDFMAAPPRSVTFSIFSMANN